ncbi:MAG TPA: hypothetical protein VGP47_06935 [Parachlamydiaceae bacterium]|nr:hypothetical protein [Parachlamydiaceae bacterium]
MTLIISTPENDPYANNHQILQCSETVKDGVHYQRRKYKIQLTGKDQFFHGCYALLCTVTIVPIFIMGLKNFKGIWKPCITGLDRKIVMIATPNTLVSNPYKNETAFQKVTNEEVLDLQELVQETSSHPKIDLNELKELLPTDKFTLDGVTYYCSKPFKMGRHIGVLALIKVDDKAYPRIFYSSQSQGTWRCMPFAPKYDGYVLRYGKGIAENDTQLPMALSLALQERGLENASSVPNTFNYSNVLKTSFSPNKTYINQVRVQNLVEIKDEFAHGFMNKKCEFVPFPEKPEALKMPEEPKKPNFVSLIEKREIVLPEYGKVKVKIFPSHDNSLHYTFYETHDKRVFIANIENVLDNPINSYGLREEAFELHNLDAALLEYPEQVSPKYVPKNPDANRYQSTKYMNNWNYIREFEIIQEYYTSQKKSVPSKI